jgi:replicative DNA helicase
VSLEFTTLRLLKNRERYSRLQRSIPERALDPRTRVILKDFGRFFREYPDTKQIDSVNFGLFFKLIHPNLKDEELSVFSQLFKEFDRDVEPDIEAGLMQRLVATAAASDLTTLIEKYQAGDEIDFRAALTGVVDEYDKQVDRKVKNPQVLDPIEDILKAEEDDRGLHWRLPCLNRHIKPIRSGDLVVVAARPDVGKTTFFADQLTHMAAQVDDLYPGEGRSILWFNNEGPGRNIVSRTFQAALGVTMEEMVRLSNTGALRDAYRKALGGRAGALRIFDVHDMWSHEVEDLMRMHKPAAVLFDMVDNIKFGGEANNNGQRTDQLLEAMYQWARLMGVKHDCGVFATSQISADGDGLQYPTLPMLKDSKTGKQGAADVIITIGAVNDPTLAEYRYMGCTKNKRVRSRMAKSPATAVRFAGDIGRYEELNLTPQPDAADDAPGVPA